RSQVGMVLNLDKCIGCHTCSVTCKNVWTSREGMEYAWFNNVEICCEKPPEFAQSVASARYRLWQRAEPRGAGYDGLAGGDPLLVS
ncbi:hypothetical protein MJM95_28345, partial [Salmonella enterica subsp. enterica serovar Anatum]|nr:hypothetical protein [Salmonella enterica subsp. enterica serovar Anatum]